MDTLTGNNVAARAIGHGAGWPGHYVVLRLNPLTNAWEAHCLGEDDERVICVWRTDDNVAV